MAKVPKVSAARGMSVGDWIASKATGPRAQIVKRLLALGKRAAPDATVAIKWNQPVFDDHGPLAFIKVATAHVTFGFWRGAELADPHGVLEGGAMMKHVKIATPSAIDEKQLSTFIREAVRLNRAKGDPTKRRGQA